jgi:hypothetical protein
MAFVYRSKRQTIQELEGHKDNSLGPGAHNPVYFGTQQSRVNLAPFSSTSQRYLDDPFMLPNASNPGPGAHYKDLNSPTQHHNSALDQKGRLAALVSNVPRFDNALSNDASTVGLGPASYNIKQNSFTHELLAKNRQGKRSVNAVPQHMNQATVQFKRVVHAPAIPHQSQSYGFQENEHGELIAQSPPQSQPQIDPSANSSLRQWTKQQSKQSSAFASSTTRDSLNPKPSASPGDIYDVHSRSSLKPPIRSATYSSAFASRSKRSTADDLTYLNSYTTQTPAANAYDLSYTNSIRLAPKRPVAHQNFGSSSRRDVVQLAATQRDIPGVGSHSAPADGRPVFRHAQKPSAASAFHSTTQRFHQAPPANAEAPISYLQEIDYSTRLKAKNFSRNATFGVQQKRFDEAGRHYRESKRGNDLSKGGQEEKEQYSTTPGSDLQTVKLSEKIAMFAFVVFIFCFGYNLTFVNFTCVA